MFPTWWGRGSRGRGAAQVWSPSSPSPYRTASVVSGKRAVPPPPCWGGHKAEVLGRDAAKAPLPALGQGGRVGAAGKGSSRPWGRDRGQAAQWSPTAACHLRPGELEVLSGGRTDLHRHRGTGGAGKGLPGNRQTHLAAVSAPRGGGAPGFNIYPLPLAKALLFWMAGRDSVLHGASGAPCPGVTGATAMGPWRGKALSPMLSGPELSALRGGAGQVLPVA